MGCDIRRQQEPRLLACTAQRVKLLACTAQRVKLPSVDIEKSVGFFLIHTK